MSKNKKKTIKIKENLISMIGGFTIGIFILYIYGLFISAENFLRHIDSNFPYK